MNVNIKTVCKIHSMCMEKCYCMTCERLAFPVLMDFFLSMSRFSAFIQTNNKKISPTARFIMPNLANIRSFIRIRWKLVKIWDLRVTNFYKEMFAY